MSTILFVIARLVFQVRHFSRLTYGLGRFILGGAFDRIDFWSIQPAIATPFHTPVRQRRRLLRFDQRREIERVVPTFTGVRDFKQEIILVGRRDDSDSIHIASDCEETRQTLTRAFLNRSRRFDAPHLSAAGPTVVELLESLTWLLQVDGSAYVALSLVEGRPSKSRWAEPFRFPWPVLSVRSGRDVLRTPRGYMFAEEPDWPSRQDKLVWHPSEEVRPLRWPLDGHRCPVDMALPLHDAYDQLRDKLMAATQSYFHSRSTSLRQARARFLSLADLNQQMQKVSDQIDGALSSNIFFRPKTAYFDVYYVLNRYRRIALVREYLLEELSNLVDTYRTHIGLKTPASLALNDYPSASEIAQLIEGFSGGEIRGEDAVRICIRRFVDMKSE